MAVVSVRSSDSDRGKSAPNIRLLTKELKVARWQTLGIQLGMTEDEIREIEQDHPGDTARRRTAMLDKWLRKEENPSWVSIIEALESMSEVNLAKKIRKKYTSEHKGEMPKPRSRMNLVQKMKKKIWFPPRPQLPLARVPAHEPTQQTSTDKVHVLNLHSSDALPQQIENLTDKYFELVRKIESDLESANPSSRDIKRFAQVYMCDEASTVEELFDKMKPFFIFDYALLQKISKFFLKQEQSVVSKLNDYIRELQDFKESTTVQQFMENIETAHNESPRTCTVTIQLVGSWLKKTISDLEKLLDELFHNKATVLTRLKIVRKCVLVTYLVQCSEAISLIEAAQARISFMMKVGVCVLQVGDTVVTRTQSETDFSFESSLIRSVQENDIDVLSFLLDISTSPDATDDKRMTGLLWASCLGRRKAANLLLKANANSNHHRADIVTPLFMASQNGHSDIVSFLLSANADPNLRRIDGVTPLFVAIEKGHSDIIHLLLKAKADPNLYSIDGVTPLFIASQNGQSNIVRLLLKASANPNLHRDNGVTPLFMASQNGHFYIVRLLLKANADPNLHSIDGVTPLLMASQNGHSDIVSFLLNAGANPNFRRGNNGVTPLFKASQNGHSDIIHLLLKAKADPNLHRIDGVTPLFMASQNGLSNIVRLLLKADANPDLHSIDGVTPLFVASQNGHSDIVSFLLNANANPNLCRDNGVAPLFVSSKKGHSDIIHLLLKANADPNNRRDDDTTPLMMASQYGHYAVVALLLKAEANPNHQNDEGMTPLMLACLNRHPRIVELLLKHGADPDLRDSSNSTAVTFAIHSKCMESKKLLLTLGIDSCPQTPDLDTADEGMYII